jgi:hypothetical protein
VALFQEQHRVVGEAGPRRGYGIPSGGACIFQVLYVCTYIHMYIHYDDFLAVAQGKLQRAVSRESARIIADVRKYLHTRMYIHTYAIHVHSQPSAQILDDNPRPARHLLPRRVRQHCYGTPGR